ncbi:uncharacterized protein LOC120401109 isoform X2 [Mauremys reevesii]|uniref:uncharacterized protein LOC120401109 isoform X2 n=1 Tax=Mauremys reevesii TaxID=260615 RepID=UPI00193F5A5C|nr:uncharacterized protein LOC120401109 isoform X2 [Mauremys reevesii]
MSRPLRMFRKKALQVVPEPEEAAAVFPRSRAPLRPRWWGRSSRPGQEVEVPSLLAEETHSRHRCCSERGTGQIEMELDRDAAGQAGPSPEGEPDRVALGLWLRGPKSPALIPSRRHRPPQGRRWRIPVPAPAAWAAPQGTAAAPGTQAAARPMGAAALFQDEAPQLMFLPAIHPRVFRCTAERAGHIGAALLQGSCAGEDCGERDMAPSSWREDRDLRGAGISPCQWMGDGWCWRGS